jgi:hypothetical protein
MAHVKSVPASIGFYSLLGFEVANTFTPQDAAEPSWASLRSDQAQLMVSKAEDPIVPDQEAVLFYSYCDDVTDLREHLIAKGIAAGPLRYPFYAPRGEFRIEDPDGYVIMITHT